MIKFEDVIAEVGEMGVFQKRMIVLLLLVEMAVNFNTLLPLMILTVPKHRCALDHYPNDTYAVQNDHHRMLINQSIPWSRDESERSSCTILRPKGHQVTANATWNLGLVSEDEEEVKCHRYVFDKEYFGRTIIEELSIVCDDQEWRTHANMAMMVGKFASAFIQGVTSDLFGRRRCLQGFLFITIAAVFANALIMDKASLMVIRFIAGLSTTSIHINNYVLAIEMFGIDYRNRYTFLANMSLVLSAFIIIGVGYVLRDYQYLCVALGCPAVFGLAAFWLVPESPRWLLSKGRVKDARKVIEYIATVNGKCFPEETFTTLVEDQEDVEFKERDEERKDGEKRKEENTAGNKDSVFSIFSHPILAICFVIVMVNWIANSLTFYGTLFNVQNLTGSIYLNFFLTSCVDVVAKVICLLGVDRFGRKRCYLAGLGLAMLGCLASIFPPMYASRAESDTMIIVLSMVGRLGISSCFPILYLYSTEIFPTTVRNRCMGIASMASRVGSVSAPYVADLGMRVKGSLTTALPLMIFGACAFISWCGTLFLPETNKRKLPDTVLDAVTLSRKTKRAGDVTFAVIRPDVEDQCDTNMAETELSKIKSRNV